MHGTQPVAQRLGKPAVSTHHHADLAAGIELLARDQIGGRFVESVANQPGGEVAGRVVQEQRREQDRYTQSGLQETRHQPPEGTDDDRGHDGEQRDKRPGPGQIDGD